MQNDLRQYTLANLAQNNSSSGDSPDPTQFLPQLAQSQQALGNALLQYKNGIPLNQGGNIGGGQGGQGGQSGNALQEFINQCEKYAELQTFGKAGMFPSAIDAASSYAQKGLLKSGLQGVKPGDLLYFGNNQGNFNAGHVGIFKGYDQQGNPIMNSATSNGIMDSNVNSWDKSVAPLLGYVPVK